jgi:hypothetical protein
VGPRRKISDFDFLPKLPERELSTAQAGVGVLDPDRAELLFGPDGALDPTEFDSNDKWIQLTMATHAAYGGDPGVRELFLEFSKSDPHFDDQRSESRWDSLSLKKEKMIGVGTLIKICRDHGVDDATMQAVFARSAADDFGAFDDPTSNWNQPRRRG